MRLPSSPSAPYFEPPVADADVQYLDVLIPVFPAGLTVEPFQPGNRPIEYADAATLLEVIATSSPDWPQLRVAVRSLEDSLDPLGVCNPKP